MPIDPLKISEYFLHLSSKEDTGGIDPMKINKLIYLAHGWHLGFYEEPLINEEVSAWKYGPVIPSVYHHYKIHGANIISNRKYKKDTFNEIDNSAKHLLRHVWNHYKKYNGLGLSMITHEKDTPWNEIWNEKGGKDRLGAVIDNNTIKEHYRNRIEKANAKKEE